MRKKLTKKQKQNITAFVLLLVLLVVYFKMQPEAVPNSAVLSPNEDLVLIGEQQQNVAVQEQAQNVLVGDFDIAKIPDYSGSPYIAVNNGIPYFTPDEITDVSFESYGLLDNFGRCGVCTACIGQDIMPTEKRGDISSVKPSGWHNAPYDFVDGKYVYNRCHLIGFQLAGENANEKNLITGTRYLNVDGMLPFENMVADFVKESDEHVMYRVSPIFVGDELVARGVLMEAWSVEDGGESVCFNVFCYNVQPGVIIDYKTGYTQLDESYS